MGEPSPFHHEPSLGEITATTSINARKQRIAFEQDNTPRRKHSPFQPRKHPPSQKSPNRPLTTSQERSEKKEAELVRKRFADAPIPMRPLESPEGSEHEAHSETLDCSFATPALLVLVVVSLLLYLAFPRLVPWIAVK